MTNFKPLQMQLLEAVLEMGSGYVLNFSDRTFAEFFREELRINIDDSKYSVAGSSKGKRMRYFLQNAPRPLVVKTLNAVWEYRQAAMERAGQQETIPDVNRKMAAWYSRSGGRGTTTLKQRHRLLALPSLRCRRRRLPHSRPDSGRC